MNKLFFLFLILISNNLLAQSSWVSINSGTSETIDKVLFLNENTGFIGCDNSVRMTTNGGASWFIVLDQGCNSIQFLNNFTGYINTGSLYKTTNGGFNWNLISSSFSYVENIQMTDTLTGYGGAGAILSRNENTAYFIKTFDGGLTWFPLNSNIAGYITSFIFFNASTGVVASYSPNKPTSFFYLYRTTNGGANWNQIMSSTSTFRIDNFSKPNDSSAVAFNGVNTFRTETRGATWQIATAPHQIYCRSVHFFNILTGFAAGSFEEGTTNGRIIKTSDGGNNWQTSINYPSTFRFLSINFPSVLTGYASAYSGLILKTTNGGLTFVDPWSTEIINNYSLSQNYPNPFNPTTKIIYELPITNYVSLRVFDVNGKEIEILVNANQTAGSYSVSFNAANYPSGVYFYKLESGNFNETRKMLLVK